MSVFRLAFLITAAMVPQIQAVPVPQLSLPTGLGDLLGGSLGGGLGDGLTSALPTGGLTDLLGGGLSGRGGGLTDLLGGGSGGLSSLIPSGGLGGLAGDVSSLLPTGGISIPGISAVDGEGETPIDIPTGVIPTGIPTPIPSGVFPTGAIPTGIPTGVPTDLPVSGGTETGTPTAVPTADYTALPISLPAEASSGAVTGLPNVSDAVPTDVIPTAAASAYD